MQVFVKRNDLTATTAPNPFPIVALYSDLPTVPYSAHGDAAEVTALYVPSTVVERVTITLPSSDVSFTVTALAPAWRDNAAAVVNAEANRRIEDVFPDYKQRNSTAAYQQATQAYGSDPSTWPTEAKAFKTEYDRGWTYVNAVRERTTTLIATMPPDPTADGYWPTRIAPVHFDPIF
jgi:hypothetical protein